MRQLFYFIALSLIITSCGSSEPKEKVDKAALFGSFEGDYYLNPYFNFKVEFPQTWKVSDNPMKSVAFGGELFVADYTLSTYEDLPIRIYVEADKPNPFAKASSLDELQESMDGYDLFYESNQIIKSPYDKTIIGGEEFLASHVILLSGLDSTYIHDYCRLHKGYFLKISCSYSTKADEKVALDQLTKFERLK